MANQRLTKRFLLSSMPNISLSDSIRYERYYLNDYLRIQRKGNKLEKEILDNNNVPIKRQKISREEFEKLKKLSNATIIRDSYLYLEDKRISIKKYLDRYAGLIRVEVTFSSKEEMDNYHKEDWMQNEITDSPLAFDKFLRNLTPATFTKELQKHKIMR